MIHLPTDATGRGISESSGKTALILGGGGISAVSYEIGCLAALDKAFGAGFCART